MAQKQKVNLDLYSNFLIANHNKYGGLELSRVASGQIAHDSVSRWLGQDTWNPKRLWQAAQPLVTVRSGYLVGDDTVAAKPYSRKNPLIKTQYSGQVHGLIPGIGIVNLLWTDGDQYVPVDYRVYQDDLDGKSKHDHFKDMLDLAERRGFQPQYVCMDSWYGAVATLKHIRAKGWSWLTNPKSNRQVSVIKGTYLPVTNLDWTAAPVHRVWLKEYGWVLVLRIVAEDGDAQYIATNDLTLTNPEVFKAHWDMRWKIETMHRGLKQTTGLDENYAITPQAQFTHIFSCFWSFLKLEKTRLHTGVSWYEQKAEISRAGARLYLQT